MRTQYRFTANLAKSGSANTNFIRIQISFRLDVIPRIADWEGCRESRRCSRDTYSESYITKYTSIRRKTHRLCSSSPSPGLTDAS